MPRTCLWGLRCSLGTGEQTRREGRHGGGIPHSPRAIILFCYPPPLPWDGSRFCLQNTIYPKPSDLGLILPFQFRQVYHHIFAYVLPPPAPCVLPVVAETSLLPVPPSYHIPLLLSLFLISGVIHEHSFGTLNSTPYPAYGMLALCVTSLPPHFCMQMLDGDRHGNSDNSNGHVFLFFFIPILRFVALAV